MSSIYYVSEIARQGLVDLAVAKGYVSPKSTQRYKGLSLFVVWLSHREFVDARPDDVKESDTDRLKAGKFPYWSMEDVRIQLRLNIDYPSQLRFMQIASEHMITNHTRLDSVTKYNSTIGAVLEAIGLKWLQVRE